MGGFNELGVPMKFKFSIMKWLVVVVALVAGSVV